MKAKKIIAVVLSLCMLGGEVSYGAPFITQSITAQAATVEGDCFSFDTETGVLTFRGTVDRTPYLSDSNRNKVRTVEAELGTIFTDSCGAFMFSYYSNCTSIDLSNVDTSTVTNMCCMFRGCTSLTDLDLSSFDTSNVVNMNGMFDGCSSLTSLDLSNFNTSKVIDSVDHPNKMAYMFDGCSSLEELNVSSFDTSNVTSLCSMFAGCNSLKKLDLSSFDTSKVTDMSFMFSGCENLTSLDVSGFDTSKVTTMYYMFSDCKSLEKIDVSGFDTHQVTDMAYMFYRCSSLKSLNLSNFDTSNVIKASSIYFSSSGMNYMFLGCSSLTSLDLSSFDTSNLTEMYGMFEYCENLTTLDLSSFDTRKAKYISSMFYDCKKLRTITLGENFPKLPDVADLPNGKGWVNVKSPTKVISGDGDFAVIENNGKNTYRLIDSTYPQNVKVTYNLEYRQARLTWDKVDDADKYGIAVYLAGKWRAQTSSIPASTCSYTTPKNLRLGVTYKVAVAARVKGKWDAENAVKNAVLIKIPDGYKDTDGDGLRDDIDPKPYDKNNNGEIIPELTAKKQYNAYVLNHTAKDSPLYENYLISGLDYKMSWEDFIDYYNEDSEFVFSISEAKRTELRIMALQMCLEDLGFLSMLDDEGNRIEYGCMGGSTKKAIIDFMLNYGFSVPELEIIEEDNLFDTYQYFFDIDDLTFQTIVNVAVNYGFNPCGDDSPENAYKSICNLAGLKNITKKYYSQIPRIKPILSDYQISQGIKIAEKDNIYTLDYTQPLNTIINEMREYSETLLEIDLEYNTANRYPIFFSKVNHGKDWDIKRINSWRTTIPNISYYTEKFVFKYKDYYMNAEDLGNYIYGYTGHACGFTLHGLYAGSVGAAIIGNTIDSEEDRKRVKWGFDDYANDN